MFSVLMSVYFREQPDALKAALDSLVCQTVMPSEVVLVKDGPLSHELDQVIEHYRTQLPLRVHTLKENVGLAAALNAGLQVVSQPWVMRFDSDDICAPDRVALQTEMAMSGRFLLFGGQISEFDLSPAHARKSRMVPCDAADIRRFAAKRNPFNHMTVCYPRELALKLGGYPSIPFMEDYALWAQMLAAGADVANSPQTLVFARIGNGMLARRGGIRYVRSEWKLQSLLVSLGIKDRFAAIRDGAARSAVFLSPLPVRAWAYSRWLRRPSIPQ